MQLAGHCAFSTTHRLYLAIRIDLIDGARVVTPAARGANLGTRLARAHFEAKGVDDRIGK
jgi:hypothetical protein